MLWALQRRNIDVRRIWNSGANLFWFSTKTILRRQNLNRDLKEARWQRIARNSLMALLRRVTIWRETSQAVDTVDLAGQIQESQAIVWIIAWFEGSNGKKYGSCWVQIRAWIWKPSLDSYWGTWTLFSRLLGTAEAIWAEDITRSRAWKDYPQKCVFP